MKKINTAKWTKGQDGKWTLIVDFRRDWEAPGIGTGLGKRVQVEVAKKGQNQTETTTVELTSRVFKSRQTGRPAAFAKEA